MTNEEQRLIKAIKAIPGYQVFPGRNGGAVTVAITRANGVSQQSVWLGRTSSIERLERILSDSFLDKTIVHMGEVWKVIGVGAQRDGNTFCHLLNLYRGRKQKNGFVGHQMVDWVDTAVLQAARKA